LVGKVEMSRAGGTWEASPTGSRKARTLLAFLGAHGTERVAVSDIVDAVWSDAPPRDPGANVATLVSRLRARFGLDAIIGARTGYWLGATVHVDLHDAAGLVTKAENALRAGRPAHGLLVAEQAVKLLGDGPVLTDHPAAAWADQARAAQETLLRRAWQVGAASALRTGAPGLAQAMAETAVLMRAAGA
jgi:DNA-binding SARP family transcriptional activator